MRYTVTWLRSAQNDLAQIWLSVMDRQAVTEAAHRIDQALAIDPDLKGRPSNGFRLYADSPLVVAYEVLPDDRLVRVVRVYHQ